MKQKSSQSGFGIVGVILLFAIIFALFSIGYYIFDRPEKNEKTGEAISSVESSTTEYKYKSYGFSLTLPASDNTTQPQVSDTTSDVGPVLGRSYSISIDPKFVGGFVTNNFSMPPDKADNMPLGFSIYEGCKPGESVIKQVVLFKDKTTCVVVNATNELAPESDKKELVATMIIQKKFTKNKDFVGLEFARTPIALKTATKDKLTATYGDQTNNRSITFAKSIKEL